ncbi:MAG: alpha/beta fold hydrolase [Prevotella sp.]|jgi:pimeloyl-ACP methyl ester carboxylesterase|nr:alpha/beta fold hydrolase [Prevotella sp.]
MMQKNKIINVLMGLSILLVLSGCNTQQRKGMNKLLIIKEQGSFTVGGTVIQNPGTYNREKFDNFKPYPEGQTCHGDHAYVFYQIPDKARPLPLVFLHGAGQSSKTWETTPDGREGFQNIFLRKGFSTYLIDQPRRGKAGRSSVASTIEPVADEQMWYEIFRIGIWPDYHEGVQFPKDRQSLENFFRQMTPNTGAFDNEVISNSMSALFDKAGSGILITHSQGGLPGWITGIKNQNVKAIVAYEPGTYPFPEGELPEPVSGRTGTLSGVEVSMEDFLKLTKIPIVMYFGDYIPDEITNELGAENWRTRLALGRLFVEAINRYGGDATLVELPKIGIHGNTHFPMSDLNNIEIADLLLAWMREKELDK